MKLTFEYVDFTGDGVAVEIKRSHRESPTPEVIQNMFRRLIGMLEMSDTVELELPPSMKALLKELDARTPIQNS